MFGFSYVCNINNDQSDNAMLMHNIGLTLSCSFQDNPQTVFRGKDAVQAKTKCLACTAFLFWEEGK